MLAFFRATTDRLAVIGDPPDCEPTPDKSVAALASARGRDQFAVPT